MPSSTLLLNGYSLLNDVKVKTDKNGGTDGNGSITAREGDLAFEADDIVELEFGNLDSNGEVTDESYIVGIRVYDNATDFYNDTVKYTYALKKPGKPIDIDDKLKEMGDTYLNVKAKDLVSDDPGAPELDKIFIAPGVDLRPVAAGQDITIDRFVDVDYDSDGGIDTGTTEVANGNFSSENTVLAAICFARGTLIETPDGPRFIETLAAGDLVSTLDDGPQPIRWIGRRSVSGTGKNTPVRIRAGALGNVRDLWVSPNHRMLVRGPQAELLFGQSEVLVAAKHLINDKTIRQIPRDTIDYFHFLCDAHQIVFAEACPAESLFPGEQTLDTAPDDARAEILRLFPELRTGTSQATLSRYTLTAFEAQALRHSA